MTIAKNATLLGQSLDTKLDAIADKIDALPALSGPQWYVDPENPTPEAWPITFNDEFENGFDIGWVPPEYDWGKQKAYNHTQKWTAIQPFGGNFGSAQLKSSSDKRVWPSTKGIGVIRQYKGASWKRFSGLASTMPWGYRSDLGFSQQYGFFEARMKAPIKNGPFWAFWLASNWRGVRPNHIEIDVVESFGWSKERMNTILINHGNGPEKFNRKVKFEWSDLGLSPEKIRDHWQTYGCLVHPTKGVFWYVNRKLIRHDEFVVHDPVHIIVSLAGHPGWGEARWNERGTTKDQDLKVDYVRAWQPFWPKPTFL